MERVYRKFIGDSVSSTIDFNEYFQEFKAEISRVYDQDEDIGVVKAFSNMIKFTEEQEQILAHSCSLEKLDPPSTICEKIDADPLFLRPELYEKLPVPENCSLQSVKSVLSRSEVEQEYSIRSSKYRGKKITLSDEHKSLNPDLKVNEDVVFTVAIYAPYKCGSKYDSKFNKVFEQRPKISQEVLVLGSQTFDVLRDAVLCVEDFNDIQGDISEDPFQNEAIHQSRIKYTSAMFYFGNDFYIDTRQNGWKNYSSCIKEFGEKHEIIFGETRSMESSKFIDLKLKLGHPYVYQHQGNCEHLIIFKSAKLIHFNDVRVAYLYPQHISISPSRGRFCNICGNWIAKWCIQNCDRLPNDPSYLCKECFKSYLYVDGKKVCNFRAYKFCDTRAIL